MKKELLIVLTVLVITSLACSFTVNLPSIETGPDKTFEVNEDLPADGNSAQVRLEVGAASLSIKPNADALVEGSIVYNVTGWEPMVSRSDDSLVIKQETKGIQGIPSSSIKNDWDLRFNNDVPMDLTINAGAYQGKIELGGLSLTSLNVDDGASDSTVKFSEPNQVRMDVLDYNTGASNITLQGLANANFKQMSFSGGAGNYTLDFSGELQNDSQVEVEAGVSSIKIVIPDGMNAEVHVNGEMKGVNTRGTWTVDGSNYTTEGSGPTLLIDVNMNLGSLDLVQE